MLLDILASIGFIAVGLAIIIFSRNLASLTVESWGFELDYILCSSVRVIFIVVGIGTIFIGFFPLL